MSRKVTPWGGNRLDEEKYAVKSEIQLSAEKNTIFNKSIVRNTVLIKKRIQYSTIM